ncbi:hypothetical protein [Nonomuraea antimicrobica]|uniref:hypothetical protein n=1 Tax=Nonomuraea antimicrobica TaxID=561173 RepID=UPI0031F09F16
MLSLVYQLVRCLFGLLAVAGRRRGAAGQIGPLLDADTPLFSAALAEVERRLTQRIEEVIVRRDMLRRLADGDRALLPDRAVALLERMSGLGFPADAVATAREGWMPARALVPEGFDDYLTDVEHALEDPRFVDLIKPATQASATNRTTRASPSSPPPWPTTCSPTPHSSRS